MNYSKLKYLTIAVVLIAGIYMVFFRSPHSKNGNMAPDFETTLIDGSTFKLSDLRGEYVLLDFWGSWCPPCRRDNPNLVRLHKQFGDKLFKDAQGFNIVTIALEKNDRNWKRASEKDGFTWKHQIVQQSKLVLSAPLALKYNVKDVPSKFLINPEGEVIGVNQSAEEIAQYLSKSVK